MWQRILKNLEKDGEVTRDKDLDPGVEEEDEEEEEGLREVEYVSDDMEESDLEEFDDWLHDGEAAKGASDVSNSDEDSEESDDSGDESPDEKDFTTKPSASRKRKKPSKRPARPKKPTKKAKVQIEYEQEMTGPVREIAYA